MDSNKSKYLKRVLLEMAAIEDTYAFMRRHLRFSPKTDTWSAYCETFRYKLADELRLRERFDCRSF
jgi:hypothetical protein